VGRLRSSGCRGVKVCYAWCAAYQIGNARVSLLKAAIPRSADAEIFLGITQRWSLALQINKQQAPSGRFVGSLSWAVLDPPSCSRMCGSWTSPPTCEGGPRRPCM